MLEGLYPFVKMMSVLGEDPVLDRRRVYASHVRVKLGALRRELSPEQPGQAVIIDEYGGVDLVRVLERFPVKEGAEGAVTHSCSLWVSPWLGIEQIVFSILFDAVRSVQDLVIVFDFV